MASLLHKNAILTGCIDSYCLVCESHLRCEEDSNKHIDKPIHKKNLDSYPFFQNYHDDHIRKVKKGYFCEFCNLLIPTAAKVGLHIEEETHRNNKGVVQIKRIGTDVVFADNLLVSEQAWNGIITDTCAICNIEFTNIMLHIADQKHVLNLIQKKVEFVNGSTVYRRIDDTCFHCLICNTILALDNLKTHSYEDIHKTNVEKCQSLYQSHTTFRNGLKTVTKDSINNKYVSNNIIKNTAKETHVEKEKINKETIKTDTDKSDRIKNEMFPKASATKANDSNSTKKEENVVKNNIEKDTKTDTNKQSSVPKEKTKSTKANLSNSKSCNNEGNECNKEEKVETSKKKKRAVVTQPIVVKPVNSKSEDKSSVNTTKNQLNKEEILERVTEFQKNGININFETESVFCKKCFGSVELNIEAIERHIEEHKKSTVQKEPPFTHVVNQTNSKTILNSKEKVENATKPSIKLDQNHNVTKNTQVADEKEEIIKIDLTKRSGETLEECSSENTLDKYVLTKSNAPTESEPQKQSTSAANNPVPNPDDPAEFAKANKLIYNKDNKNAFCRVCNKRIPASLQNMKEHIFGAFHKTKAGMIAKTPFETDTVILKRPMEKFIKNRSRVVNPFWDDIIINDKYCLTRLSYFMITEQNRLRCQVCEVNLSEREVDRHLDSYFHERAMDSTPVVWSLDSEFVREVRHGLFHCGYCNLIVGKWEDVSNHLKCEDHEENKDNATERLEQHLPGILAHRAHQERNFLRHMFERFPFFF